jgi:hypothetical protein
MQTVQMMLRVPDVVGVGVSVLAECERRTMGVQSSAMPCDHRRFTYHEMKDIHRVLLGTG